MGICGIVSVNKPILQERILCAKSLLYIYLFILNIFLAKSIFILFSVSLLPSFVMCPR